jgi:hypothetical protein
MGFDQQALVLLTIASAAARHRPIGRDPLMSFNGVVD